MSNLNDSGTGSLREALTAQGKRRVEFAVEGVIELQSPIYLDKEGHAYLTLVGESAPGAGITIRNYPILIQTHDVKISHLRCRRGATPAIPNAPSDLDALSINNGSYNITIDHCSLSWGVDAICDLADCHHITISNCILSEALRNSIHPEGAHSMGMLMQNCHDVLLYNCLFAHCGDRVPLVQDGYNIQIINVVIYNSLNSAVKLDVKVPSGGAVDVIGSVNKSGLSTNPSPGSVARYSVSSNSTLHTLYQANNRCDNRTLDSQPDADALLQLVATQTVEAQQLPFTDIIRNADDALTYVLASAGAFPRDAIDARIVADVQNGTGTIIDDPGEVL